MEKNATPCFIIAELSGNHHQKFAEAEELVYQAAKAGASAVKSQTYTADTITLKSDRPWFRVSGKDQPGAWQGRTLYDLYQEAHTPWEWLPRLKKLAEDLGMVFFTSVFDETAIGFNEYMGVKLYKIAAYEAVHLPLIEKVAKTHKPLIMSIGFANEEEISDAVNAWHSAGGQELSLLHCLTAYSGEPDLGKSNLRTIEDIKKRVGVNAGLSDNNAGIKIPIVAAIHAGATIIEKHLILNRELGGPDARFSIEPDEFKEMVRAIRAWEKGDQMVVQHYATQNEIGTMLGRVHYGSASQQEAENMFFRPSIWVKKEIEKGETFTLENTRVARPNSGLKPKYFKKILNKKATQKIEAATPLTWDMVSTTPEK